MQIQRSRDFCIILRKAQDGLRAGPVFVNTLYIKTFFDSIGLPVNTQFDFFNDVKTDVTERNPADIDVYSREQALSEKNPTSNKELEDFVRQLSDFTVKLSTKGGNTDNTRS